MRKRETRVIVTKSCSCCVGWGEFHTKALVKNKLKAGGMAVGSLNAACCFGEEHGYGLHLKLLALSLHLPQDKRC